MYATTMSALSCVDYVIADSVLVLHIDIILILYNCTILILFNRTILILYNSTILILCIAIFTLTFP